jgi:UDP-3-O-[3-hydroxymyristoyl] glucosamine N-acyltransferase
VIDPRFYVAHGPLSVTALAAEAGGTLPASGAGETAILTCAPLDEAEAGGLSYCDKAPRGGLMATRASACFVRESDAERVPVGTVAIVAANPRAAFAKAAKRLFSLREHVAGPLVSPDAKIEDGVVLGPGAVIGAGVEIGRGTVIGPNAVIYPGVSIGRDCRINAGVVLRCALIGDRVTISGGSVIGEAGFGVAPTPDGPIDVPQLGRVILQDDVSIGSLCAVDRGAFGDTVVGLGSKIDNFTQIAHNVRLGRGVVIAAFGGISGSVTIGDYAMLGGRVGVPDHLTIGAGAQLAAMTGILKSVPPGETWGGYPGRHIKDWLRETVALRRLADGMKAKASKGGDSE